MPLYEFLEKDVQERCRLLLGNVTMLVSRNFLTPSKLGLGLCVVTFIFLSNAIS